MRQSCFNSQRRRFFLLHQQSERAKRCFWGFRGEGRSEWANSCSQGIISLPCFYDEWRQNERGKKQQQQGNLAVEKLIVSVKREVALKWSRLRTKASNVQNNARQQKAFAKKSTQNRQELICTLSCFVSLFILRSHATGFRMAICGNFCKVFLKTTGISSDCTDILVKLYCMRGPFTTTKILYGHTRFGQAILWRISLEI